MNEYETKLDIKNFSLYRTIDRQYTDDFIKSSRCVKKDENEEAAQAEFTPSETSKAYADKLTDDAILNYETYLEKNPEAQDKSEVESRINDLKKHTVPAEKTAE